MGYLTYTTTLVDGAIAAAADVNGNFTDVLNSLSDGTKAINVKTATVLGTFTVGVAKWFVSPSTGNQVTSGSVAVADSATVGGRLSAGASAYIGGALTAAGSGTIGGALNVVGSFTVSGGIRAYGVMTHYTTDGFTILTSGGTATLLDVTQTIVGAYATYVELVGTNFGASLSGIVKVPLGPSGAAGTPVASAGFAKFYAKNDDNMYMIASSGVEKLLSWYPLSSAVSVDAGGVPDVSTGGLRLYHTADIVGFRFITSGSTLYSLTATEVV